MKKATRRQAVRAKAAGTAPEPTVLRMMREFRELSKCVPKKEWAKIPADALDNLDHYIYGSPKKPARR